MSWFKDVFGKEKVVIASMYLPALPGSPDYCPGTSLAEIIAYTRRELVALEQGGMDGVNIGNQQDWPYRIGTGPETAALMARVIGEAVQGLKIPFGITVFWDDQAAIAVAKATVAAYVRGVFRGVYAGEMGLLSLSAGDTLRYRKLIDAGDVRLMFMLRPILGRVVGERDLKAEVKDAMWGSKPEGFALCGPIPGEAPTMEELELVAKNAKGLPVVMNNGATPENIAQVFGACSGAVIGTHLRKDFNSAKPFDSQAVGHFMEVVNRSR